MNKPSKTIQYAAVSIVRANNLSEEYNERAERTRRRAEVLAKQPGAVKTRPAQSFLKAAGKQTSPINLNKSRR